MALIKLTCYKRGDSYFDYDRGTEEKWVNTKNIHRMERANVYGSASREHTIKPITATLIYLNEWVSKYEPKKELMVVETPEYICEKSKE